MLFKLKQFDIFEIKKEPVKYWMLTDLPTKEEVKEVCNKVLQKMTEPK